MDVCTVYVVGLITMAMLAASLFMILRFMGAKPLSYWTMGSVVVIGVLQIVLVPWFPLIAFCGLPLQVFILLVMTVCICVFGMEL
ncbi:hypothetical protein LCGC14_0336250 [marine sediment metagenome]|uniref:Uncharacterized protein n=1 Tax=marine sediment metagenome TaxID=412755 RepID=A0A0F9TF30_9ZZZZ